MRDIFRRSTNDGYILPATIALGIGISIISVFFMQYVVGVSDGFNRILYMTLADETAHSGIVYAQNCLSTGDDIAKNGNVTAQTECDGFTNGGTQYGFDIDGIRSYFTISPPDSDGNIASTGVIEIYDPNDGTVTQTFSRTSKTRIANSHIGASLTAGYYHTCGLADGKAYCWGYNQNGEIGDGTTINPTSVTPVDTSGVLKDKAVSAISGAGNSHSCVIADGKVYCWGGNTSGQLGNGTTTPSLVPIAVNMSGALSGKVPTTIATGGSQSCVIADGKVYCWGAGFGTSPVLLDSGALAGKYVTSISAPRPLCAIAGGKAYCYSGGTWVDRSTATALNGRVVTQIVASNNRICVLASSKPYCWGNNTYGGIGDGTNVDKTDPTAVDVSGVLSGKVITTIDTGDHHTCAIANGKPYCWGFNNNGQLGDNTIVNSFVPITVVNTGNLAGQTVTQIAISNSTTCAVANLNTYCWGPNAVNGSNGLLYMFGSNKIGSSRVPVPTITDNIKNGSLPVSLDAGTWHNCVISKMNIYCWGHNGDGQLGVGSVAPEWTAAPIAYTDELSTNSMTQVASGRAHSCAISNGKAYCWGNNLDGQLGNGTADDQSLTPRAVDVSGVLAGKVITKIAAGDYHACAVADGKAYCWGYGGAGALGHNSTASSNSPVAVYDSGVLAGKVITDITAGENHTCAIADGQAYCWGGGTYGQLGNNGTSSYSYPQAVYAAGVLSGKIVTKITTKLNHTCAIADGQAYCWGNNGDGEVGDGTIGSGYVVPIAVGGALSGQPIDDLSAGGFHTCALTNGKAYCWGYAVQGSLGNGTTTPAQQPLPQAIDTSGVIGSHAVLSISAGGYHTCARVGSAQISCWGYGQAGRLGDGTEDSHASPIATDPAWMRKNQFKLF